MQASANPERMSYHDIMATPPKKRRPSSLHTLPPAVERDFYRAERNPRLHIYSDLLAELQRIAPGAFIEPMPASEARICSDRRLRVKLLEARARLGLGLFHAGDTVYLTPETKREGRHHHPRRPA